MVTEGQKKEDAPRVPRPLIVLGAAYALTWLSGSGNLPTALGVGVGYFFGDRMAEYKK